MYPTAHAGLSTPESRGLLVPLVFCALSWASLIGVVVLLL